MDGPVNATITQAKTALGAGLRSIWIFSIPDMKSSHFGTGPSNALVLGCIRKRRTGRVSESVTACSLVFMPRFVRPIRLPLWLSAPFFDRGPVAVRCAFSQVASIMNVFGTLPRTPHLP